MLILLSFNLASQTDMPAPIKADTEIKPDAKLAVGIKNSFALSKKKLTTLNTVKKETGITGLTKAINTAALGDVTKRLSEFSLDAADEFESLIFTKCNEFGCDPYQVIRIMYCESKADIFAKNGRYLGLFQQDYRYWEERSHKYGAPGSDIYDPYAQIQVATKMFSLGMSSHWGCK